MLPHTNRGGARAATMALAAVSLLGSVGCVVDSDCGPVTVAEMTWPTAAFAANVEHIVLQHGYGCLSEIVPGNTVPTLTAMVERGEPDVAPEVWLNSIRLVVERGLAEGRLRMAGDLISDGGDEGWYVPEFVVEQHPELGTLDGVLSRPDLFPDDEEPGKGRFYTCPPGWACQIIDKNLYRAFGMEAAGFTLFNPGSGEGLSAAIARAQERREPIFAYFYTPSPLVARYPMRKLKSVPHDPSTWPCMTTPECQRPVRNSYPPPVVKTVVSASFAERAPEAFAFVSRVSWSNASLSGLMDWQETEYATPRETAVHFLRTHESVWTQWVPEDVAARVRSAL